MSKINKTAKTTVVKVDAHEFRTVLLTSRLFSTRYNVFGSTSVAIIFAEDSYCVLLNMNLPLIVACVGSVVACVGAAYGLQKVSPVPPVRDRDVLQTTSVTGKVAFLTKDAIKKEVDGLSPQAKLKKLFDLYVQEVLSLEDTLEFLFKEGKDTDVEELYKAVMNRIYQLEPEPPKQLTPAEEDELEYMKSFQKALEKAYSFLKPVERPTPSPSVPASTPIVAYPTPIVAQPPPSGSTAPLAAQPLTGGGAGLAFANGGQRRRNVTQKHSYPVVRTILYA